MRITFLGTRGEIELRTRSHLRHSALLVEAGKVRAMIDCGADWSKRVWALRPDVILLTHAHDDHAGGLRGGSPAPVYATDAAWSALARFGIAERVVLAPRRPVSIGPLTFEPFPVEHSLRAPAVGFRVSAAGVSLFYVPDVVAICERAAALAGVAVYVGDGAAVTRPILRRRDGARIGHASIREQLGWCADEGVGRAVFTHCGSEIVRGDGRTLAARVRALGAARGVRATIARDGMQLKLAANRRRR
jgi:glyoxylase-like metal-dependent hydrolase (beta-lactamase superfamily II)